jgi:hypothetical protein
METNDYVAEAAHQWRIDRDLSGLLGWRCVRCGGFRVTQPVLGERSCVVVPGGVAAGSVEHVPVTSPAVPR